MLVEVNMFTGMQKVEYATIETFFPHALKVVNISTASSWQEELYILSTFGNPMDIQNPEPAEIVSIMLFHSICLSFPHPWVCVELQCGAEIAQASP